MKFGDQIVDVLIYMSLSNVKGNQCRAECYSMDLSSVTFGNRIQYPCFKRIVALYKTKLRVPLHANPTNPIFNPTANSRRVALSVACACALLSLLQQIVRCGRDLGVLTDHKQSSLMQDGATCAYSEQSSHLICRLVLFVGQFCL